MAWRPDYITLAQLRAFLRVPDDMTDDDAEYAVDITTASRAIDRHCNRQFGKVDTPEERFYRATWHPGMCRWIAHIDDVMTTTGMGLEIGGVVGPEYVLHERNAVLDGEPWTRVSFASGSPAPTGPDYEIAITATWGWTAVPSAVALACRLQASRFAARRESPWGVAGSPDLGNEIRLLAKVDPDVAVSLANYVRPRRPQ